MSPEQRLRHLHLSLGTPRAPKGRYVGARRQGDLLYVSGQTTDGWRGALGADLDVEAGRAAARDAALNGLSQAAAALGTLDAVVGPVKVVGFVACVPGFTALPQVIDGASDLLAEVFGEAGRHARSAVGVAALPGGSAVEVEMVLEVHG